MSGSGPATADERRAQWAAASPHNYDPRPKLALEAGTSVLDADGFWSAVTELATSRNATAPVIVIDAYPGVDHDALRAEAARRLPQFHIIDVEHTAALPSEAIDTMLAPSLTSDRVFGRMSQFTVDEFYDPDKLATLRQTSAARTGPLLLIGWGADLAAPSADVLVLADIARWEIQLRQRAGQANWRCDNGGVDQLRKYKRSFFVEWRAADRHKRTLFDRVDFVLDASRTANNATALHGADFRTALDATTRRPFRVVPYFDPGVWGGEWMQATFDLPPREGNYAWSFDCVPEENSLLFVDDHGRCIELPAMDLVLHAPRQLLGERTYARFGAEFPIRFDLLDTMAGEHLSLQVHPLSDYMQQVFGMPYTQDESYYMLDVDDDAIVYLGLRDGIDPAAMLDALSEAQSGGAPFPAAEFVGAFPARKHDHFAIPAGTVHSAAANSMVLEISATPYIFTFKLWDWGRLGLDGVPRPIHLEHGAANIQWDRDATWTERNLVGQVEVLRDEPGHREERTGLHELEFIEVRRHWFDRPITLDTRGTVNVLNLVEGASATLKSASGAFEPFQVHYAESFIVPAAVGAYELHPDRASAGCGVVVASVRGTEAAPAR